MVLNWGPLSGVAELGFLRSGLHWEESRRQGCPWLCALLAPGQGPLPAAFLSFGS